MACVPHVFHVNLVSLGKRCVVSSLLARLSLMVSEMPVRPPTMRPCHSSTPGPRIVNRHPRRPGPGRPPCPALRRAERELAESDAGAPAVACDSPMCLLGLVRRRPGGLHAAPPRGQPFWHACARASSFLTLSDVMRSDSPRIYEITSPGERAIHGAIRQNRFPALVA